MGGWTHRREYHSATDMKYGGTGKTDEPRKHNAEWKKPATEGCLLKDHTHRSAGGQRAGGRQGLGGGRVWCPAGGDENVLDSDIFLIRQVDMAVQPC